MSESPIFTYRIELFTSGLLITGSYDLPLYRRISDALNADNRSYLPLRDATVAPLAHPQQVQRVPDLLVYRAEALLVAVLEEPLPPPDYYSRDDVDRQLVPRATQQMIFFTSAFVVRARFYKRPDLTLTQTLDYINDDFIPLNNAQIFPLAGGQPLVRPFACISRSKIAALCEALPPVAAPQLDTPPSE
jgi:hypothetical protein